MRTGPHPFKDEHLFQESRYREALRALDVVDAFVLDHSGLEFEEFFFRLQNLDAWHDLLANLDALQAHQAPLR